MVVAGLLGGSIALALAIGYARWLDDIVIADAVLWVLLTELGLGVLGYGFLTPPTRPLLSTSLVDLGDIAGLSPNLGLRRRLCGPVGVLATALIGCFYFLLGVLTLMPRGPHTLLAPLQPPAILGNGPVADYRAVGVN